MPAILPLLLALTLPAHPLQTTTPAAEVPALQDTDRDGLSDALEQALLDQFAPDLRISRTDCSTRPAEFVPGSAVPKVQAEDGTLYGQAFLPKDNSATEPLVELHFYHLWRQDCGPHGHPLDTEHVAVLLQGSSRDLATAKWTALYWYAAAHESTVCDVSQIARASTLHAVDHGATIWASPDKHASYLDPRLCQRGCGADHCTAMVPVTPHRVINLGEIDRPMNGSRFISSAAWPLRSKMSSSNFPPEPLARLHALPDDEIAWFHGGRHPAQGVISISSATQEALAHSGNVTTDALNASTDSTAGAIAVAGDNTGKALDRSARKTLHALGASATHVRKALGSAPSPKADVPR